MTSMRRQLSELPMRPISDKDMELVDLDQLFEDYVETDLLQQLSNSTAERSSSEDLAHLFDLPSSTDSDAPAASPLLDREEHGSWQPTEKLYQQQASFISNDSSSFCINPKTKESLSDSESHIFEDLFGLEQNQLRSVTQPSTPRPPTAKAVKKAVSFQERTIPRRVHKHLRKSSSTPFAKMMQPSAYYRAPIPDIWTRKPDTTAEAFNLRTAQHTITSPPPSAKIVHHENAGGFFSQNRQPYTTEHSPLTSPDPNTHEMNFSNYQLTPQASPSVGISGDGSNPFNNNMGLTYSSSVSSAALSALQTPPSTMRLPMTTWGTETSSNLDFAFSASPGFAGTKTAGWWNDDAVQPVTAPAYRESHERTPTQAMSYSSAGLEGLGITGDNSQFADFGVAGLGISGGEPSSASASSYEMGNYGPMYPTPPQQHIVPIGHRPLSRSPSPTPQPSFHRRRPSTHSHQQHHRTQPAPRRKSSGGSQQSRQASSAGGGAGFVNFTPDDSRKILTGVAPSGSSKTKARREKEAAEKRRKLSQAAMKAVMEAGGDVDSLRRLEREGLLVLES